MLAIISPVYNAVPGPAVASLVQLVSTLSRAGTEVAYLQQWLCSNLPRARNELLTDAFDLGAKKFLFIDDDISFDPIDFAKLNAAKVGSGDLISGCYRRRVPGGDWVGTELLGGEQAGDLVEMHRVGMGFLLASRAGVKKMLAAHDAPFAFGEPGGPLGEDDVFCDRWRGTGGRIWAHRGVALGHIGLHIYR